MMNGTKLDTLASPFEQQRERFLDPDRKLGVLTAGHLVERSRERLTQCIACHPPRQRGGAIGTAKPAGRREI
jgi:hypothetical protein